MPKPIDRLLQRVLVGVDEWQLAEIRKAEAERHRRARYRRIEATTVKRRNGRPSSGK